MAMACTTTAALLSLCSLFVSILAKDYTVGDSNGWTSGVDYTQWTGSKTLLVGDNLIFNYSPMLHTVMEVSSADYSSCSSSAPLNADTSSGSTTIALTSAGSHYFICGTPSHCSGGMKMAVLVSAATGPTTSSQLPTPTTTPTTTTPYSTTPSSIVPPGTRTPTTFPYGSSAPAALLSLSSAVIGGAIAAATVAILS
ncbi:Blue copper protein [Nymphaea thermarum]|nr:Blue copper protein [Nymphaea thermarum]